jgi:hypothetical protein
MGHQHMISKNLPKFEVVKIDLAYPARLSAGNIEG